MHVTGKGKVDIQIGKECIPVVPEPKKTQNQTDSAYLELKSGYAKEPTLVHMALTPSKLFIMNCSTPARMPSPSR